MVFLVSTPTAAKKRYVWIEMIHCIALYASAMQISIHVSPTPIISFHGGSNDAVVIAVVSRVAILPALSSPEEKKRADDTRFGIKYLHSDLHARNRVRLKL